MDPPALAEVVSERQLGEMRGLRVGRVAPAGLFRAVEVHLRLTRAVKAYSPMTRVCATTPSGNVPRHRFEEELMRILTMLSLALTLALVTNCGVPESADQSRVVDPATITETLSVDSTTEKCGGKCCWFQCENDGGGHWRITPVPGCGTCGDYARYSCPTIHHSPYRVGSARWGECP